MKIYTKTGDDGTTGVLGPKRIRKDDPRIDAYGTVDELNAVIGVARAAAPWAALDAVLAKIQEDLFVLGSALADPLMNGPFYHAVTPKHIAWLEGQIDELQDTLPKLTKFILPGGTPAAAQIHLARTVCRRAERSVVHLTSQQYQTVSDTVPVYLNRLSDALFVIARALNQAAGVADVPWSGL
jgi:cob(I)alamin adenosyltransferase